MDGTDQKDKDLFPNLEYRTVNDGRVRPEHRALDGTIKPINDPFWDKYYPPNGWRCRCYVIQTTKGATAENPTDPTVKPEFHVNVGKTGAVFSEKHPYFAVAKTAGKTLQKNFELTKLYAPYNLVYKAKNGATVQASIFADLEDYHKNYQTAKVLADNNISSKLIPHLNDGSKNPEFTIGNIKGDRVEPKTKNIKRGVSNAFNNKLKKGKQLRDEKETFIIIDLSTYKLTYKAITDVATQSWSKFKHYKKTLKFVVFQHKKNVIKIDVKMLDKGYDKYREEILKIKKSKE